MSWRSKARPLRATDVAHFVVDGVPACAMENAQHAHQWADRGEPTEDSKHRSWAALREQDHLCVVCRSTHRMICSCPRCAPMLSTLPGRVEIYDALVARGEADPAVVQWGDRMIVGRWVSIGRVLDREDVPGCVYVHRSPKRAIEVIGEGATWFEAGAAAGVWAPKLVEAPPPTEDAPGGAPTNGTTNGASVHAKTPAGEPGGGT